MADKRKTSTITHEREIAAYERAYRLAGGGKSDIAAPVKVLSIARIKKLTPEFDQFAK